MERKWWIIITVILLLYYVGHRDSGNTKVTPLSEYPNAEEKSTSDWYSDRWYAKHSPVPQSSDAYNDAYKWSTAIGEREYQSQKEKFDYQKQLDEEWLINYGKKLAGK
jgi:hypothetical protein